MPDTKTTAETTRSPIDGSELVRLATPGANWKATLNEIFLAIGLSPNFPATNTSPGDTGTLAYDTLGNLYLAYAPNSWTKIAGASPFNNAPTGTPIGLLLALTHA